MIAYATALSTAYNIGGVYVGNADFGSQRIIVALKGSNILAFTGAYNTLTRQANDEYVRPATVMDITWDGTRFWTFDDGGNVWKHSTNKAPSGRNTVPIQARHTWYDNNGTAHETDGGPIETLSLGARQWLRVETDPAPDTNGDPLDNEKADNIRIYVSNDGVTLPRLQTADGWAAMSTPTVWRKKARNVTSTITSGLKTLDTFAQDSYVQDDVGGTVTGTGIPAGAKIVSVTANGDQATMDVAATASGAYVMAIAPFVFTRSGVFESINNGNSAPPGSNGFILVNRAPGAFKSTRTDVNGALINIKGDGSGRIGPWQFDNLGKTLVDFGSERPGTIIFWPSTSVPLDCAACQGQAVKRPTMVGGNGAAGNAAANNAASDVAPYIRLWQLFGTQHGVGDGSTTFNLPDIQRRVVVGAGGTVLVGRNDGITTVNSRTFAHVHTVPAHGHADTFALNKDLAAGGSGGANKLTNATSLTGSVTNKAAFDTNLSSFDDIPSYALLVLIKL